jgi:hypothetical protein
MDDVSKELADFLSYLTIDTPTDSFTHNLQTAVSTARNNPKWRDEYMTLEVFLQDAKWEGHEEGLKEGTDLMATLMNLLLSSNRLEDAKLAALDPEARTRLLKEFGLDR